MQLTQEHPDYRYFLRAADGRSARVNTQQLSQSFIIAPDTLQEDWPVKAASAMTPADLEAPFALRPDLILLGTGSRQVFPPAAVLAACLQRRIGLEVMDNAAAARTYTVLAGEGRKVVAGFILGEGV